MSKGAKILLAAAMTIVVLVIGSGLMLAATVARAGMVTVRVHEPGKHIDLHLPAAVLYLGMDLLPLVLDDEDFAAEIRADLGEHRHAVAAALRELENVPDAVLVDVQDGSESVRISKRGRYLEIHVVNPEGTFDISLPAGVLGRVARVIA
jgi:hypothetical protein